MPDAAGTWLDTIGQAGAIAPEVFSMVFMMVSSFRMQRRWPPWRVFRASAAAFSGVRTEIVQDSELVAMGVGRECRLRGWTGKAFILPILR